MQVKQEPLLIIIDGIERPVSADLLFLIDGTSSNDPNTHHSILTHKWTCRHVNFFNSFHVIKLLKILYLIGTNKLKNGYEICFKPNELIKQFPKNQFQNFSNSRKNIF